MLAFSDRSRLLIFPKINTQDGTVFLRWAFWQKFDFSRVKISWMSRKILGKWQIMNAMTIAMKIMALRSSFLLRIWLNVKGEWFILKFFSNKFSLINKPKSCKNWSIFAPNSFDIGIIIQSLYDYIFTNLTVSSWFSLVNS